MGRRGRPRKEKLPESGEQADTGYSDTNVISSPVATLESDGVLDRGSSKKEKTETQVLDKHGTLVGQSVSIKDEHGDDEYNVEIIKDYHGGVDVFYLNKKDPEYEYRFLNKNAENISMKTNNQLFHGGGWQIVPKKHLTKLGFKESMLDVDGHYVQGFNILAFMPKKLFEEKIEQKKLKANDRMKSIKRLIEKGNPGINVHKSMRGIQAAQDSKIWKDSTPG